MLFKWEEFFGSYIQRFFVCSSHIHKDTILLKRKVK